MEKKIKKKLCSSISAECEKNMSLHLDLLEYSFENYNEDLALLLCEICVSLNYILKLISKIIKLNEFIKNEDKENFLVSDIILKTIKDMATVVQKGRKELKTIYNISTLIH